MSYFPCEHFTRCEPQADLPLRNLSSEGPDVPSFFGIYQCGLVGTNPEFSTCTSIVSQAQADACAAACYADGVFINDEQTCIGPCGSSFTLPRGSILGNSTREANNAAYAFACASASALCLFSNASATCSVTCADSSIQSHTVPAGSFSGASQAAINELANSVACSIAQAKCFGALFASNAQSCSVVCPMTGGTATVVVPAGVILGLSQAAADAQAHELACALALISCPFLPVLVPSTAQSCSQLCDGQTITQFVPAGAFVGATVEEANQIAAAFCTLSLSAACQRAESPPLANVGNTPQTCQVSCPSGGTFSATVQAGSFRLENQAAANAAALSYCQAHIVALQFCLGDLDTGGCVNSVYASALSGIPEGGISAVTSGTLPPGLSFSDGLLAGILTTPGVYTFTITAANGSGNSARDYTISVGEITPDTLSDGSIGTPYAQALTAAGFTNPTWSVAGGTLPDGLGLQPATGVISGTPTTSGESSFVVEATEGTLVCSKELSITISGLSPIAWYTFEQANPAIDVVGGANLTEQGSSAEPLSVTAGKVNLALTFAFDDEVESTFSGLVASLAPGIQDLNFFGWHLMNPAVAFMYQQITYLTNAGEGMAVRFNNDGSVDVFDTAGLPISLPVGTVPANTWVFWHLKIAAGTGDFSFALNNGAPTTAASDYIPAVAPTASIEVEFMNAPAEPGIFSKIDELAIFNTTMTQAQVDEIYNAGNGRTYP